MIVVQAVMVDLLGLQVSLRVVETCMLGPGLQLS